MKVSELKVILEKAKIPPYLYNLDGRGRTDERYCLRRVSGGWQVYYSERGIHTTEITFETEDEACVYICKKLLKD